MKVKDIAIINKSSYSKKNLPREIFYLDTANLTEGHIENIQRLDKEKDTIPSRAQRKVDDKTILYSTVRPRQHHYGILSNPPSNMIVSTGFATLDAKTEFVDPYYLYYQLISPKNSEYLATIADTATSSYPSISPEDIGNIEIELPSISEQKRIAEAIKCLDHKIAINKTISLKLEYLARLIYDYWFVQFDFPNRNGRPYKSSGGKMVWCEELKREIPEGWLTRKISEICDTKIGGTPNTEKNEYWNGDINWLSSSEIATSPVLDSKLKITKLGMTESTTEHAKAGAVVMSIVRYIRPAILGIDSCFNQSVISIVPSNKYRTSYIYPMLCSCVDTYMKLRTGAQQPHINKQTVDTTRLVTPPDDILNRYYKLVDKLFVEQLNISKESKSLTDLRDFLLPLLMNYQVTFK